jgi:hypothetical protein
MLRSILFASVAVTCTALSASASVITYPALDQSFSHTSTGSDFSTTAGPVSLDAAHVFNDGRSGSPVAANTRYYGGYYSYSPNGTPDWGGAFELQFNYAGGSQFRLGKFAGSTNLRVQASTADGQSDNTGVSGIASMLPFVVKFEDDAWNRATARIFLGAAAETPTEGAPTLSFTGLVSEIDVVSVQLNYSHAGWASGPSSAAVTGFFSSTTWTPVVIPEPATLGLLAGGALLALRRR